MVSRRDLVPALNGGPATFNVADLRGALDAGIRISPSDGGFATDGVLPPSGADKTITVNEDESYVLTLADFGFDDGADGDSFQQIEIYAPPAGYGSIAYDPDGAGGTAPSSLYEGQTIAAAEIAAGALVFIPAPNDSGSGYNGFGFYVHDSSGARADSFNYITFDVDPQNNAPTAAFTLPDVPLPVNGEFTVNLTAEDSQGAPSIATLEDGSYVVVWLSTPDTGDASIVGQYYNADGTRNGGEFQINTNGDPMMRAPVVTAVADGGFVVAWSNWQSATTSEMIVAAQRFDENGDPVGGEFTINTTTGPMNSEPSIAAHGNGLVVVWQTFGTSIDIVGQRYDLMGDPVGGEFTINSYTTGAQQNAEVAALQDGGFIVTWTSVGQDGTDGGVYAQRFDADGDPAGTEFRVNNVTTTDDRDPHVAVLEDGSFIITWMSRQGPDGDIHARHYAADGTALGNRFVVWSGPPGELNVDPRVTALADGGFVVAWHNDESGDYESFARRYDANAVALGDPFSVNTQPGAYRPVLAGLADGSFMIVWGGNEDGDSGSIQAQHFAGTFAAVEEQVLDLKGRITIGDVDSGSDILTLTIGVAEGEIAADAGSSGVAIGGDSATLIVTGTLAQLQAFLDTDPTSSLTFTPFGNTPPASAEIAVTIDDGTDQTTVVTPILLTAVNDAPYLDLDFTDFTATGNDSATEWTGGDAPVALAWAVELDDDNQSFDGATVTAAFTANGTTDDRLTILSVGDGTGEIRVDGSDLYYEGDLVGSIAGGTDGSTPLVITFNAEACHCAVQTTIASIAFANASATPDETDRTVTITLVDGGGTANGGADTASAEVTITVSASGNEAPTVEIDAPLAPVGGEQLVNTTTAGPQQEPKIAALEDGGYVIVWASGAADFSDVSITAQIYAADGTPVTSEFIIDNLGEFDITRLSVSALDGGGFVVAWQDVASGFGRYVKAQRFDAFGDPIAIAVQVTPLGTGGFPVITGLEGGGYVVTWLADDGEGIGVHAQIYDATDTPVGTDFIANETLLGTQTQQAVSRLADGGFVVAWTSFNTDSSFTEVFARRFDTDGNPVTGDFLVPTTSPTGDQGDVAVTGLANGGFVITWTQAPNYTDVDVHGQLYDANGDPVGGEFVVNTTSTGGHGFSNVTALADGGFLVSWQYADGMGNTNVYAQRYDANGATIGGELQITDAAGEHNIPVVAGLTNGGLAVAWQSNDGSSVGIYSQLYLAQLEATEQVALDLKGKIAIDDADAGSDIITVTLAVSEGVLNVDPGTSGVTVDDSDQQAIILTGTLAEIQALLGSDPTSAVTYTYDDDYLPVATIELSVTIDDGTDSSTDTVTIDLTPVNDAADLDLDFFTPGNDATATYVSGDPLTPIAYNAIFDDDNVDWDGATMTVAITGATADDQLVIDDSILPDTVVTGNEIYYDGDLVATFTGGTNGTPLVITFNEDACACAIEEITYGVSYSNSGTVTSPSTRDVTFTFVDGDGTANGGQDTATATVELTVSPSPTPPVIDAGAAASGFEEAVIALTGVTITDDGDPVDGLLTVHLSVEHGTLTIRTDVAGGIDSSNILNSATGRGITISGTPEQINATLAASNGLIYQGDLNFFGSDALTVRANDATPDTPLALSSLGVEPFFDFPSAVALHDIDGDGIDDLVAGLGDGSLPSGVIIVGDNILDAFGLPGGTADAFAFGDFDGDGETDIGVASWMINGFGYVGYYSSDLEDFVTIETVGAAIDLVAGDFDGNGLMDLAAANSDEGNIAILLQTAPGVFAPAAYKATIGLTVSIATGDFNGDGVLDLLASNYGDVSTLEAPGSVELFLGVGDGSFEDAVTVWTGASNADGIVVADFNGDGFDDFAFASSNDADAPAGIRGVQVALGNGNGGFGTPTSYVTTADGSPHDIQAGDLNGDGIVDLVVTNMDDPGTFSVLIGNGDGSFQAPVAIDTGEIPYVVALGDPDDDGDLDLIVGALGYGGYEAFNNDGIARGSTATKAITVNNVSDAPTGTDATLTIDEDETRVLSLADFGFGDVDGNAFVRVRITTLPSAGTLWFDADGAGAGAATMVAVGDKISAADLALGKLSYRPALNASGAGYASFTFQMQDNGGTANGGANTDATPNTITFDVTPVDDFAVAGGDIGKTFENAPVNIDVLANDSDVDDPLQITSIAGQAVSPGGSVLLSSGARVTLNVDGTLTYDPNGAYNYLVSLATGTATGASNVNATESFTYSLSDGVTATVQVKVRGVDGAGDMLMGTAAADQLNGTSGNDIFDGLGGADRMRGGLGDDTYYVDNVGDKVQELTGEGHDTVYASVSYSLAGQFADDLILTGTAVSGTGNGLANLLAGNAEANTLSGGAGADSLYGGLGADTLTGGADADRFFFDTALGGGNVDTITDFDVVLDSIHLDRSIFTGIASDGTLDFGAFRLGATALDADDRILFDATTGNLYYDEDGSGGIAAVLFAQVTIGTALTNDDFIAYL